MEYGLYREQYDALAEDLEKEGVLVRVLPAVAEDGIGTENAAAVYDLAIQVGAFAGEIISTAELVEIVQGRLRGREGRDGEERRAKIYLANGDEHEFIFGDEYD